MTSLFVPEAAAPHRDVRSDAAWRALAERYPELARAWNNERVTDIFINGSAGMWVEAGQGAEHIAGFACSEREAREIATALVQLGDRHLDDQSPCVDVHLAGGERIHAVLAPLSTRGTAVSIRLPRVLGATLERLERLSTVSAAQATWLRSLVYERANMLVTGGTGTGKTTLLGALLSEVPASERLITIEDVAELNPAHAHHVALEARQANLEGAGGIAIARLVREALRMRPDRIVVGECRGAEIRELLTALNTGHDGGGGTLHASGLEDVPARLEALGALAGMSAVALARQSVSAFDAVLHLTREADARRLTAVGVLRFDGEHLAIDEVEPWVR